MDDEFKQTRREYYLANELAALRDRFEPFLTGEIERGVCPPGKSVAALDKPGMRKFTLKDARELGRHLHATIVRVLERHRQMGIEDENSPPTPGARRG